ncbi:hypothetical protein D3C76_1092830 [compost metagenome]
MVKKIPQEQQANEAAYEGVLSLDAVKTLSLNAVHKYYGTQLTLDDVQFELMSVDKSKLRELFKYPERKDALDYILDPDNMTGSLFNATMTVKKHKEVYALVLNDKDGDILRISKSGDVPDGILTNDSYDRDKALEAANQFVEEIIKYPLSKLQLIPEYTQWDQKIITIFYRSKEDNAIKYGVHLNFATYEMIGFSKDVMALISYNSSGQ